MSIRSVHLGLPILFKCANQIKLKFNHNFHSQRKYFTTLYASPVAPKPSLKIRTASAIFWNYLGIFRDYGLKYIFFRNKTFFVFQDRKLKLSVSVWKRISTHSAHSDNCYLSGWVEILWGFTKLFFKQMLKVSAFYLKKQKSVIPKKIYILGRSL